MKMDRSVLSLLHKLICHLKIRRSQPHFACEYVTGDHMASCLTFVLCPLTPASHMEVGCPGTWGLELLTPNPGSKSTPKACPTRNPATSPARHTQPQPKHPSRRARSSVEIIITVITNNNNNNNDNNNKVIITKGRGGWEKTLKHSKN